MSVSWKLYLNLVNQTLRKRHMCFLQQTKQNKSLTYKKVIGEMVWFPFSCLYNNSNKKITKNRNKKPVFSLLRLDVVIYKTRVPSVGLHMCHTVLLKLRLICLRKSCVILYMTKAVRVYSIKCHKVMADPCFFFHYNNKYSWLNK